MVSNLKHNLIPVDNLPLTRLSESLSSSDIDSVPHY